MDEALDAQTWTIVIGVVLGFFAVPAAMLASDLRRQRRERARRSGEAKVPARRDVLTHVPDRCSALSVRTSALAGGDDRMGGEADDGRPTL